MIDCQKIRFSQNLSNDRISSANNIFGGKVVKRILAFSLFLLGGNRNDISESLDISANTMKSNIRALHSDGIAAFEDRRQKKSTFLPVYKHEDNAKISMDTDHENGNVIMTVGSDITIQIPLENTLQLKTFILTLLNNDLITAKEAATILKLSMVYVNNLSRKIESTDTEGLIDKRKGQTQEYVFKPEIKAELIQQYVVACISQQKTSGKSISEQLKERCELDVSERTIRYHIAKLGLSTIKKTLPELLKDLKKTFKTTSRPGQ
jgi:transposase